MRLNKNSFDLLLISFVFYIRNSLEKQTENSGVLLNCINVHFHHAFFDHVLEIFWSEKCGVLLNWKDIIHQIHFSNLNIWKVCSKLLKKEKRVKEVVMQEDKIKYRMYILPFLWQDVHSCACLLLKIFPNCLNSSSS